MCKANDAVKLGKWGYQLATIYRQATFDFNVPDEITFKGKDIPGGEITIDREDLTIKWIVINKEGKGFGANIDNNAQMQQVLDKIAGGF